MNDVIISRLKKGMYHEDFCPYVNRIGNGHRRQIPEKKAIKKGYCACKFCHSVRGIVYKYRQITGKNISYDKIDNALCVKTDVGFWKLVWRENEQVWRLYHMNHKGWKSFDNNLPSKKLMRGSFHRQKDYDDTTDVMKAIKYIFSHDKNYKIAEEDIRKLPRNTPTQRDHYRKQKSRKKREGIRTVMHIFKQLERER